MAIGPGISSFVELANGLGPIQSVVNYSNLNQWWVDNPHALNMKADLVFIDMMKKGGYSMFISTSGMEFDAQ